MSSASSMSHPTGDSQPSTHGRSLRFVIWAFCFVFVGVLLCAFLNRTVVWSSSDNFCGQFCHSMIWASAAYKRGPHYQNSVGVQASCGNCHIPYDAQPSTAINFLYLLVFKADRGAKDFYGEATHSMSTKEVWEQRRPMLIAQYEGFLKHHNYITCRGCHQLDSFSRDSTMAAMIHAKNLSPDDYKCLNCHSDIGHVYEEAPPAAATPAAGSAAPVVAPATAATPSAAAGDWYSEQQAQSGADLYSKNCASCHGANLEGGAGPSLVGASWKGMYGGKKLLKPWGDIHGPMAQLAGTTFTEQQSMDILAFLLEKNGLPAGPNGLTDTKQLSRVISKN